MSTTPAPGDHCLATSTHMSQVADAMETCLRYAGSMPIHAEFEDDLLGHIERELACNDSNARTWVHSFISEPWKRLVAIMGPLPEQKIIVRTDANGKPMRLTKAQERLAHEDQRQRAERQEKCVAIANPIVASARLFARHYEKGALPDSPPEHWALCDKWDKKMRSLIERFIRLWDDSLWHEPIRRNVLPAKIDEARKRLADELEWIASSGMPGRDVLQADLDECRNMLDRMRTSQEPAQNAEKIVNALRTIERDQHGRIARAFPALGWIDPTADDYQRPGTGLISKAEQRALMTGTIPRHGAHPMCIALAIGDVFDRDNRKMSCTDEQRNEIQRIAIAAMNSAHVDPDNVPGIEELGRESGMSEAFGVAAFDVLLRTEKNNANADGIVVMAGQEIRLAWFERAPAEHEAKDRGDPLPTSELIKLHRLTGRIMAVTVLAVLRENPDKTWAIAEIARNVGKNRPSVTRALKKHLHPLRLAESVSVAQEQGNDSGNRWKLGAAAWER